ncbi:MAG: TonB-dependent receptor [Deltaproteobacteria bacterium]|nr:TonB-dependent receptor [Deltaproteobacteria bacterium]
MRAPTGRLGFPAFWGAWPRFALVARLLAAGSAAAQPAVEEAEGVVGLEPIEVVAPPEPVPAAAAENPSRFVEVLDGAPVREGTGSVADVVEDAAGVRVRRHGGLGSFATISIRGAAPSQVPVFIDGVPAGDARSGVVSLEELPAGELERIEVYRGFAPATLGDAGIGGALQLVTRAAPAAGGLRLSTGMLAGSFETWRGWVAGAGVPGRVGGEPVGLRLHFSHRRSAGNYRFLSDHGTPFEPDDDEVLVRRNNDASQTVASARLAVPLGEWSLDAALSLVAADQGLAGLDYDQAEAVRLSGTDGRVRLVAAAPMLADGLAALELGGFGAVRGDRFSDPRGEIGVGRQVEEDLGGGGGLWGMLRLFPGDGSHLVRLRLETSYETFRAAYELPAAAEGPRQGRWVARLAGGYEVSLCDDELVLLADLRADAHVDDFSGDPYFPTRPDAVVGGAWDVLFSPSAGLRWAPLAGLELRGNVGWFHRVPTFGELFGDRGTVIGNAGLRSESAVNLDLGPAWRGRDEGTGLHLRLGAAFFASFADDLIVFVPQSQSVFRAENIGASRTLGLEATLCAGWRETVGLDLAYTFQEARDTGDAPYWSGLRLPGRAPHDLSARLALRRWGLELWYELDWLAEAPLDRANLRTVPGRVLHGVGLGYRLRAGDRNVVVAVEGRNLSDEWVYDAFRYPLPGRSVFASFVIELGE